MSTTKGTLSTVVTPNRRVPPASHLTSSTPRGGRGGGGALAAMCRATGEGEGWTLIGQLIYDANHHTNGSAVLVMGDHGTTGEGKPHPKGQPPMGKCAEACINKVKVPVLLVRGNAKALLEQHDVPVTQRRGMRTQDSRGNLHEDAPGGHGLNITVCVDGTNLSKKNKEKKFLRVY